MDSFSETGTNQYTEETAIIANRLMIWDTEEFAEEMIQKCINNSFKDIRFSYDLSGYSTELRIHIYIQINYHGIIMLNRMRLFMHKI